MDERDAIIEEARDALALVNEQAEDEGLWFIARTAPEAYLQQELRRLHAAVERDARAVAAERRRVTREIEARHRVEQYEYDGGFNDGLDAALGVVGRGVPEQECDGSSDCKASTHIEGCFASVPEQEEAS